MSENELLPCPWCGETDTVLLIEDYSDDVTGVWYRYRCGNVECPSSPSIGRDSRDGARELWNTRPEPSRPATPPELADLIDLLRALSRHEHDDHSVGEEAADELEDYGDRLDALERATAKLIDMVADPENRGNAIISRFENVVATERDARRTLAGKVADLKQLFDQVFEINGGMRDGLHNHGQRLAAHDDALGTLEFNLEALRDRVAALEAAPVGVELTAEPAVDWKRVTDDEVVNFLRLVLAYGGTKSTVGEFAHLLDPTGALWERVKAAKTG